MILKYMTHKSTSLHNLNADKGLNKIQKKLYLILNWINNQFPYTNIDKSLVICDFRCDDLRKYCPIKSSPARWLSDLFLQKLPWDQIYRELGRIKVMDTGCGTGDYGIRLIDYSNNRISCYCGSDIHYHANWEKLEDRYPHLHFFQTDGKNILDYIPDGTNFFMTVSAIEHFEEDLSYFHQIRDYIRSYHSSVIQIHLFPSSSCLALYRSHGVRQYTPRNISKITRLFNDSSYSVLFSMGGKACNDLHYEFITRPLYILKIGDMRDLETWEYDKKLLQAIEQDMKYSQNSQKSPTFYALVIHSNWKKKMFL